MSIDAESILKEAAQHNSFLKEYRRLVRMWQSVDASYKADNCPLCGQGLKKHAAEDGGFTVVNCMSCGWHKIYDFLLDEASAAGDPFLPGVSGKIKGTPVVRMDAAGRIKAIEGV